MRLSVLVEATDGGLLWVSPPDADPQVGAVVTTDLLDPGRYLAGGELVLTGLAWWRPRRPARTRSFVSALVQARVSALAAGEAGFDGVPADLVEACAAAGLPLLRVPVAVSFATISERAAQHLSGRRSDDVAAMLGRHRALVAAATRGSGGLEQVLDLVHADVGLRCWVLSPTGRSIAGADPPDPRERRLLAQHFLRAPSLPHRVLRPGGRRVTVLSTSGSERLDAWLLAIPEDHSGWSNERRAVVDELAQIAALERGLVRSTVDPLLTAALDGPASALEQELRRSGLNPESSTVVIAGVGRAALAVLAEAVAARRAFGAAGDTILAVVNEDDAAGLLATLRTAVDTLAPGLGADPLRLGVSDAVCGAPAIFGAVAEALAAASVHPPGVRHSVTGPERLGSLAVLLAAVPAQLRDAYLRRVLGAVIEHDRAHRTQLLHTLEAYLACSGSWSRCAQLLHVHVNTLRYRIERIEELTGRDLRSLSDQADLLLALAISPSRADHVL